MEGLVKEGWQIKRKWISWKTIRLSGLLTTEEMLYVLNESQAVVSSSPEFFLTRSGNNIYSMPIKGTINSNIALKNLNPSLRFFLVNIIIRYYRGINYLNK